MFRARVIEAIGSYGGASNSSKASAQGMANLEWRNITTYLQDSDLQPTKPSCFLSAAKSLPTNKFVRKH